jgi:hypothetical protein
MGNAKSKFAWDRKDVKPRIQKPSGPTVTRQVVVKHLDGFPSEATRGYVGSRKAAKKVARMYKARYGKLPEVMYFCKEYQWRIPLPEGGEISHEAAPWIQETRESRS